MGGGRDGSSTFGRYFSFSSETSNIASRWASPSVSNGSLSAVMDTIRPDLGVTAIRHAFIVRNAFGAGTV